MIERDGFDLAAARVGGRVLQASDEFFAPKESLLLPGRGEFVEGKYTDRGKWMDGWETRRRRGPGHDWCIVRLGLPGVIHHIIVDTHHFKGNHPESCSLEAGTLIGDPEAADLERTEWLEVVPRSPLLPDCENTYSVSSEQRVTHLRLNIYPDGGVARLRVLGEARPDWKSLVARGDLLDLAAVENGGAPVTSSDQFFGEPIHLIMPGRAADMGDGWETRRRRGAGHDWVILRLGHRGIVEQVLVDTLHFKGNYPESCSIEGCDEERREPGEDAGWQELLPRFTLQADSLHTLAEELRSTGPFTHIRFNIYPDGGVSRLRVLGRSVGDEGE